MKIKSILGVCFITALTLMSCSGEDGEQGPQGLQGQTGNTGAMGPAGEAGEDGNANVQRISVDVSTIDEAQSIIAFEVPELTAEVLQTHIVLFYLEGDSGNATFYTLLPGVDLLTSLNFYVSVIEGGVTLLITDTQGSPAGFPVGVYQNLHVVIIEYGEGSPSGEASKTGFANHLKQSGVDINDYKDVVGHYGL